MTGDVARTPAEEEWLRVSRYLHQRHYELAVRIAAAYPPEARVADTPLLTVPAWRLPAPVPLGAIKLEFRPDTPLPAAPDVASLVPGALPERADGTRYQRYSDVTGRLAAPAVYDNRPVYRLIEADLAGPAGPVALAGPAVSRGESGPRLAFSRARYFDGADFTGPAAHEYAGATLAALAAASSGDAGPPAGVPAEACPYQAAIGGPAALTGRVATMATCALTLRYDRATGTATFPLHCRQPGKVGHAAGMYTTIPVGVFQPSGEAKWNEANDFSLWRGLLREYAEELLGADEDHGSEHAPIDYAAWPLARAMTDGLADGTVRAWCLGLGADPLTFALDLLAVVVIDAPLYDNLFGGMVDDNAEGRVIKPRLFDAPSVTELVRDAPLQAATAALLTLALTHRATLLAD